MTPVCHVLDWRARLAVSPLNGTGAAANGKVSQDPLTNSVSGRVVAQAEIPIRKALVLAQSKGPTLLNAYIAQYATASSKSRFCIIGDEARFQMSCRYYDCVQRLLEFCTVVMLKRNRIEPASLVSNTADRSLTTKDLSCCRVIPCAIRLYLILVVLRALFLRLGFRLNTCFRGCLAVWSQQHSLLVFPEQSCVSFPEHLPVIQSSSRQPIQS